MHHRIVRFGLTLLLLLLALVAVEQLRHVSGRVALLPVIPVVIYVTAAWGATIGLFALAAGTAGVALLMEPRWSLFIDDAGDRRVAMTFVAVSCVAVWLSHRDYRLRNSLREREAEFRALFELAAVGTAKVDALTGKIVKVNQQMSLLTGFEIAELLQKSIAQITHPADRERDRETYAEMIAGLRAQWRTEKRYVHKNGSEVWVLVHGTILRGLPGQRDHFIAHAVDISARRSAEAEARRLLELKDEFLATLSHELRTPLNVLAGWLQLLRKRRHSEDVQRAVAVLERNVDNLRHLTDDLLGMADVLAGDVAMQRDALNVSALLAEVTDSASRAAAAKGVLIHRELAADATVRGDERRLRQVVWNLLTNALKFTPPGGVITIATRRDEQEVVIEVADTGIGITSSFLPHVFEKFRQEDSTATREHSGLGLGLAVAREFAELHGGTITVQSGGRHQGAMFVVRLPVFDAAVAAAADTAAADAAAADARWSVSAHG